VGKAAFPIVESSAQHIFGWFDIATVALRSHHESLDSADMYVEASTELKRCALDRVGPLDPPTWPVWHQPRRARGSRAVNRPNYVALVSPDPLQRRAHSAEGNIVLSAT
jgi:hypothetical protein